MSKIRLNKELYSIKDIEKAKQSYRNLAEISFMETDCYYILTFDDCYYDEDLTMKEYDNYVIDLMVSKNGN